MSKHSVVITFRINDVDDPDIFAYFDIVAPGSRSVLLREMIRSQFIRPGPIDKRDLLPIPHVQPTTVDNIRRPVIQDDNELTYTDVDL